MKAKTVVMAIGIGGIVIASFLSPVVASAYDDERSGIIITNSGGPVDGPGAGVSGRITDVAVDPENEVRVHHEFRIVKVVDATSP